MNSHENSVTASLVYQFSYPYLQLFELSGLTSGRRLKITFLDVLDYSECSDTKISTKKKNSRKHSFLSEEAKGIKKVIKPLQHWNWDEQWKVITLLIYRARQIPRKIVEFCIKKLLQPTLLEDIEKTQLKIFNTDIFSYSVADLQRPRRIRIRNLNKE